MREPKFASNPLSRADPSTSTASTHKSAQILKEYYTVLHCAVMYCAVLYCTCTVLYCTILCCTVQYVIVSVVVASVVVVSVVVVSVVVVFVGEVLQIERRKIQLCFRILNVKSVLILLLGS